MGGFESLLEFYDTWADQLDAPAALLVVRYEDLHARPDAELRRVLAFVGAGDVSPASSPMPSTSARSITCASSRRSGRSPREKLRPGRPGDLDTYKTRRGRVGGHRDELTVEQIARLDELLAASAASRFGYTAGPR